MKKIFSNKKAQITIFIIVGIILLFSSALIFYIKNKVTGTTPDMVVIQQTLPEDLEGIKKYVEQCVYTTGKQAVTLLGTQGGYIYPQAYDISGNTQDPTESASGISPFPNIQNYIVPYWYYLESTNTCNGECRFASKRPTLSGDDPATIESQITRYVEENLEYCISDFEVYKNMGYTVKLTGPIKVKTTIARSDVVLDLSWPMIAGQENKKELSQFIVHLPIKLKDIYNFADKVMSLEQNQSSIGTHTKNTIQAYAADRLPSTGKMSYIEMFKAGGVQEWSFIQSKKIITDSIATYTQTIKVKNTLNFNEVIDDLYDTDKIIQAAKFKMVLETNSTEQYPYEVNFRYSKNWPLYLDITPREGDIVKGTSVSFGVLNLIGMAIKKYEFQYDISYPIIATISDPEAFYGEGYDFTFAFETNIRNNKILKSDFYAMAVDGGKIGFECDEAQKKTGNITVNITDGKTGGPVKDAVVSLYFGKNGCIIGNTNSDGMSVERYPKGIAELVAAKTPDYLSSKKIFAAKENMVDAYNFTLYPIQEKKIIIKRYVVNKNYTIINGNCFGLWKLESTATPVDMIPNETISILFKRVKTQESGDISMASVTYEYADRNNTQIAKLFPGKYELRVIANLNKNITIPAQDKSYEGECDWMGDCDYIDIHFNETSSYPYNEGMLEFSNSTGNATYLEIKPEELYNPNTYLEVYALVYDLDSVPMMCRKAEPNDFSPSPDAKTLLSQRKTLLTPKFKNYTG